MHTVSMSIGKACWAVPIALCSTEKQKVLRNANRNTNGPNDEFSKTWSTIRSNNSGITGPIRIRVHRISTNSAARKHITIVCSKFIHRLVFWIRFSLSYLLYAKHSVSSVILVDGHPLRRTTESSGQKPQLRRIRTTITWQIGSRRLSEFQ